MLTRETPDFISPTLWPPNSPDLNPVDYKVWSVMQDRVYQTTIHDINDLKQRLLEVRDGLNQRIIDVAVAIAMAPAPSGLRASRRGTF